MPNHVANDLRITGIRKELLKFKEFAKDAECLLSANKFIPYPEKFEKMDKEAREYEKSRSEYQKKLEKEGMSQTAACTKAYDKFPHKKDGYNSGGHAWCVKNWGTKWGMYEIQLLEEDYNEKYIKGDYLYYTFHTAWSPPLPIIKKMSELFPTLEFDLRYFEQGQQFNGIFRLKNNKILDDRQGEYFGGRGG